MAEYIDRAEYCEKHCRGSKEFCTKESCPIWKAPAADVAPVVRCKDCKYNRGSKKCLNPDSFFAMPKDDDFCSYGERKSNEYAEG